MTKFKDLKRQAAYEAALQMHDVLSQQASGQGIAYRRGWNGDPYDKSWTSYPIYAAGRDNRKKYNGGDLPPAT